MAGRTDWDAWHEDYADPGSDLSQRLEVVRTRIGHALDATAPEPVRVVSSCAGDGRDLLHVLERRDDAARVSAVLVETDPRNVRRATDRADRLASGQVTIRRTDAGTTDAYVGAVPAQLVLLCGIFGNVTDADVRRTIAAVPQLCAPGALVIWTRHRREPDLTPRIRRWFAESGLVEEAFVSPGRDGFAVGAHRFTGRPRPLQPGRRLFTFVR